MRRLFVSVLLLGTSACREPDLAPLRAELASSAELVCAAPVARPPHTASTRVVHPAEVEAAIVKLCNEEAAQREAPPELLGVVHEALVQDRAITGDLRRSRMMLDAAKVDSAGLAPGREGTRTAEEALAKASAGARCSASWPGLARYMLAAAIAHGKASRPAEALALCADVIALARDEDLTGGLTELLLANGSVMSAVKQCTPLVDAAPKESAAKLATALGTLRSTFPTALDEVARRERAEMMLFSFGKGRDAAKPMPCERATAFAAAADGKPLTRADRIALVTAWSDARQQNPPLDPKYLEAYSLTLRVLDTFIAHAKSR